MRLVFIALVGVLLAQCQAFTTSRCIGVQPFARAPLSRFRRPLFAADMDAVREDGESRMQKSIDNLKLQLGTIRAGKATPSLLDRVMVNYNDKRLLLNKLARISVAGPLELTIEPYDKASMAVCESGIRQSDTGGTVSVDSECIRLRLPPVTEESRKDTVKKVKATAEESKIVLRNVRRECTDKVKKAEKQKEIGENESRRQLELVQKLLDKHVKMVDEMAAAKEKQIMSI